jgi:signal peptidase I
VIAITLALVIKTYAVQAFYIPSGSMQNTLGIGDRVLINKIVYHTRGIARGDIVVFNGDSTWDYADAPPRSSNPVARLADALEGIVGITHGSDIYIKRVIALPGDHIRCCDAQGRVTVNGVPLTEQGYLYPGNVPSTPFPTSDGSDVVRTPQASAAKESSASAGAPAGSLTVVVPAGHLWVMGDHRDVSYDSRGHMGDPGGGAIPENAVMGRAFVVIWPASKWGFLNIPATFEQPGLTSSPAGGPPAALPAAPGGAGVPVRDAWTPLPLALGFAGAIPLTWLQRRARKRLARHRRPSRHEPRE